MTTRRFAIPLTLLLLVVAGCSGHGEGYGHGHDAEAPGLTNEEIATEVLAAMDRSADPCQDFYQYACGGWFASTELPGDETRWGRSFSVIAKRNREFLREYLESGAGGSDPELDKLGEFYGSCTDEAAVEAAGTAVLKPLLDEIATVEDAADFMSISGRLQRYGINVPFSIFVAGDFKDSSTDIAHFIQGGLGMPERDYYLKTDDESVELLAKYESHVSKMLGLSGDDDSEADARAIVAFETELAKVSRSRTEMRQIDKLYHKIDIGGLKEQTPRLAWDGFLEGMGYPGVTAINVTVPEFFDGLETIANSTDAGTLRSYLRWNLVSALSDQLPQAFIDENFEFFSKTLAGQAEIRPRWRRCVAATDGAMGELLGRGYVEKMFPGDSKQIALDMIHGIEGAFQGGLASLVWMDETTQGRAVTKMEAIVNKIGYPDKWRDYSSLTVDRNDYFGNTLRANEFEFRRNADKVGQPVDPEEWGMTPPQVNAYYNPLNNEIVFPAGILQQPFFHRDFPASMNFGGIGMVMGHELTHGFDDQGRKFDPDGEMSPWWDESAVEKFAEATTCVEELYSGYEVQPGLNLNGKLTLGENIADLGGIKEAYVAYKAHVAGHPAEQLTEELNDDQLFFVAQAQTWCSISTKESEELLARTDSHSHARYRVIGPNSQLPAFAEVFECAPGTPMNPADRCEVW